MTLNLKTVVLAAGVLGAGALASGSASAAPMSGLDPAVATSADLGLQAQDARWVCGPFRCRWAPNVYYRPRAYFYGGPRRHWGWRRRWY